MFLRYMNFIAIPIFRLEEGSDRPKRCQYRFYPAGEKGKLTCEFYSHRNVYSKLYIDEIRFWAEKFCLHRLSPALSQAILPTSITSGLRWTILPPSINFGSELKISTYIDQIQSWAKQFWLHKLNAGINDYSRLRILIDYFSYQSIIFLSINR